MQSVFGFECHTQNSLNILEPEDCWLLDLDYSGDY